MSTILDKKIDQENSVGNDECMIWNVKTGEFVCIEPENPQVTATYKHANLRDFTTGEVKRMYTDEEFLNLFPKDDPFAQYKCAAYNVATAAVIAYAVWSVHDLYMHLS